MKNGFVKYLFLLSVIFIGFANLTFAQQLSISGTVIDSVSGAVIENANVAFENTNIGTVTNKFGSFYLKTKIKNKYLLISFIGYKTAKLFVTKSIKDTVIKLTPISYLLQQVSVYSKETNNTGLNTTIKNEQIRDFAGISKDAMRAVQLLPGVSTDNGATARFNVRGGTQDENLVLINGVEVHNPFHMMEDPMTSVGIFNIDMVKSIDFSAGGFPAEYGNALSSLLKVDYSDENYKSFSGKLDLSMVDANVIVRGPVTNKSSFILGFRKSFVNFMLKVITPNREPDIMYYDMQGQYNYNLSPSNKLNLDVILSSDNYNNPPHTLINKWYDRVIFSGEVSDKFFTQKDYTFTKDNYSNSLFSLKSANDITNNFSSETFLSFYREWNNEYTYSNSIATAEYSKFPQLFQYITEIDNLPNEVLTDYYTIKNNFNLQLSDYYSLKFGGEYRRIRYHDNAEMNGLINVNTNTVNYPDTTIFNLPRNQVDNDTVHYNFPAYSAAAYLENIIQLPGGILANIGGRINYFNMNKNVSFSPRVSVSYLAPTNTIIRGAWGYYYEMPNYAQLRSSIPSDTNTNNQRAEHFIVGLEHQFSKRVNAKIDFYYKRYTNLIPADRLSNGTISYAENNDDEGYAKGIDMQLVANLKKFYLWLSYGYLVAREKPVNSNQPYYPRFTDQTSTLSADLSYRPGDNWEIGCNIFYGSGYAYTPYYKIYNGQFKMYLWMQGNKNSAHYPAYERVDLRITKQLKLFNRPLQVYLDVLNLFDTRNVLGYNYSYDPVTGLPEIKAENLLPLIPALGVSYSIR